MTHFNDESVNESIRGTCGASMEQIFANST